MVDGCQEGVLPGTSFQFFPGGGQHFDRLPRGMGGGQNMKKQNDVGKNKKKSLFSKS